MPESIKGLKDDMGYILMNGKKYSLDTPNVGIAQNDEDIRAAVEFFCGDCCKRIYNAFAVIIFTNLNLAFVLPVEGECLRLEAFCGGKLVEKQILNSALLSSDRICSIESYSTRA